MPWGENFPLLVYTTIEGGDPNLSEQHFEDVGTEETGIQHIPV
jgi:hypothetical protein